MSCDDSGGRGLVTEAEEDEALISPTRIGEALDRLRDDVGPFYRMLRKALPIFSTDDYIFDAWEAETRLDYQALRRLAAAQLEVGHYALVEEHWRTIYSMVEMVGCALHFPNVPKRRARASADDRKAALQCLDMSILKGRTKELLGEDFVERLAKRLKRGLPPPPPLVFPEREDPVPQPLPNSAAIWTVHPEQFDLEEFGYLFYQKHVLERKPTLVKKAFTMGANWNHQRLREILAYRSFPVEIGSKYTDENWHQGIYTAEQFFDMVTHPDPRGSAYLAQHDLTSQVKELEDDLDLPPHFWVGFQMRDIEKNVWIGPAGTVSPLHSDPKCNLFCQLVGKKFFRLIPPEDKDKVLREQGQGIHKNTSMIDPENPDLAAYPQFPTVRCFDVLVEAGDLLYIPQGWLHYVRALTASSSVNYWLPPIQPLPPVVAVGAQLSSPGSSTMDVYNKSGSSSNGADSSYGMLAMPYKEFDIVLKDINEEKLEKIGIAEELEHLSAGKFSDPAFPVQGTLHGVHSRLMVPLTFQRAGKPNSPIINVWCLIATGSPFTCLTVKTLECFFGLGNVVDGQYYPFAIQDQQTRIECQVSRRGTHFEHVNILGIDSLRKLNVSLTMNWRKNSFSLIRVGTLL